MPLRLMMILQSYPPVLGGAQRQVQRLGPHLARRGVNATVVTRRPPGTPSVAHEPGLEVRRVSPQEGGAAASVAFTVAGALQVVRLRPDVVHVHDLMSPATVALMAAIPQGIPVIAKVASTGAGGDVDRLLTKPLGRRRLHAMAARFATFVCLSDDVHEELVEHGVPPERLVRIPNGVDAEHFRPAIDDGERAAARSALGATDGEVVVLNCGRWAGNKRLDQVVRSVADLPEFVRLVLIGEGPEGPALRKLGSELGLDRRLELRPTVEDPAYLYRGADLYASASVTEGMSGAVLEALATGIAVVACPASGMDDLLADGAGVLTGVGGFEALAAAMAPLVMDEKARSLLGQSGRARVVERFSLAGTADRLVALYRELALRHPLGRRGPPLNR